MLFQLKYTSVKPSQIIVITFATTSTILVDAIFSSLDADVVDQIVFEEMQKKLTEFKTLSLHKQESFNLQIITIKSRITVLDQEIFSWLIKSR